MDTMDTRAAVRAEWHACGTTLAELGPDAPTLCPPWTAADIATHLIAAGFAGGIPSVYGRWLVARGVRLNDSPRNKKMAARLMRRVSPKGFDWCLDRFRREPPRLLGLRSVAAVTLFETWVHHEDVRRANGLEPDPARDYPELAACLAFVARYQRKRLRGVQLVVSPPAGPPVTLGKGSRSLTLRGPLGEAVLWLGGRPAVARIEVDAPDAPEAARLTDPPLVV